MELPKDPVILLSFVNTQLRDHYASLSELAAAYLTDEQEIAEKLAGIQYFYNREQNQFR